MTLWWRHRTPAFLFGTLSGYLNSKLFVKRSYYLLDFPLNCLHFQPRSFHPCHPYAGAAAASSNVCRLPHHPPSFGVCCPVPSTSQGTCITFPLMAQHPSLRCGYTVNVGCYSALYGRRVRRASIDMGMRFRGCIYRRFISLLVVDLLPVP